jgi:hypothetical protein
MQTCAFGPSATAGPQSRLGLHLAQRCREPNRDSPSPSRRGRPCRLHRPRFFELACEFASGAARKAAGPHHDPECWQRERPRRAHSRLYRRSHGACDHMALASPNVFASVIASPAPDSVVSTLWLSMTAPVGSGSRSRPVRSSSRSALSARRHLSSRHHLRW